jgi:hypothetical protein
MILHDPDWSRDGVPCKRCGVEMTADVWARGERCTAYPVCPFNPRHELSADREANSYYCYACAEHYVLIKPRRAAAKESA